jgi:hypothetical protein
MENSLSGAIQKMGGNFLVAAFVPAMGFIIVTSLTFNNILPPPLRFTDSTDTNVFQSAFNLLLFTTVLGFTLYTLSTFIYKAFEGYTFIFGIQTPIGRSFLRRQLKRFQKNETDRQLVEKQLISLNEKINRELERNEYSNEKRHLHRLNRYYKHMDTLQKRQYSLSSEKNEKFPPDRESVLPTRFGNILCASEMYGGIKYGLDSVPLWGRLAHVIPPDGMEKIDHANNQCLFLLNGALLASVYTLICLLVSIFGLFELWIYGSQSLPQIKFNTILIYLTLGVLSGAIAWLFYIASLYNVSQYGNMIRTAYDLYRFNLIEALHLNLPKTLKEERQLWRRINYFVVGNDQWEQLYKKETLEKHLSVSDAGFEYIHQNKPEIKNA